MVIVSSLGEVGFSSGEAARAADGRGFRRIGDLILVDLGGKTLVAARDD